jgi:hypothetical protein
MMNPNRVSDFVSLHKYLDSINALRLPIQFINSFGVVKTLLES